MTTHADKAKALAAKVTATAEDGLRPIEMMLAHWPAEFRAIMWGAVSDIARKRQVEADLAHSADKRPEGE